MCADHSEDSGHRRDALRARQPGAPHPGADIRGQKYIQHRLPCDFGGRRLQLAPPRPAGVAVGQPAGTFWKHRMSWPWEGCRHILEAMHRLSFAAQRQGLHVQPGILM